MAMSGDNMTMASNFVGANNELKKAFNEMNDEQTQHFLANTGVDWLIWLTNAPAVSYMGGK